jgi:hypothetical protein
MTMDDVTTLSDDEIKTGGFAVDEITADADGTDGDGDGTDGTDGDGTDGTDGDGTDSDADAEDPS